MTRTTWRLAALAGAASLVLAGCGGGDTGSGGATGGSEEPAAAGQACTPPQAQATGNPSTAPLKIGSLLPETGSLAFLGPPEFAGVDVAVEEINAAGGVLGNPVQHLRGDSGDDTTDIANQTVDRQLSAGTQVIVGAAASGVSKLVIDKITGAGVVQFSPANTSDEFTNYNDKDLYFRTAPPDVLQARALADLIIADGNNSVGILALNDPYGTGLAENTRNNLIESGLAEEDVTSIIYDPQAQNYDSEVQQMVEADPDAIVVIGFEESSRIIEGLNAQGIGPQR
jgi:ABC-type branched-subunit amino acid transport system substrate-binding protein